MKKALFLDRDGVINKEKDYLYKIEDFEFIDDVFEVCRYFQKKGYLIIVITNQSGIARGRYSENDFVILTDWMIKEFEKAGVNIARVYNCPHYPDISGECECRKPGIKMIQDAQNDFHIDLSESILVGDKNSDVQAGKKAGIGNNFLILTGHRIDKNEYDVKVLNNLSELKDMDF